MSRLRIAGIAAALALAGCSDDSGVTEGTVPFKSGNVDQLNTLKSQMQDNVKNRAYTKKPPAEDKSAKGSGEAKPSAEGKGQEKKP